MRENRPSGLEGGARFSHLVPTPISLRTYQLWWSYPDTLQPTQPETSTVQERFLESDSGMSYAKKRLNMKATSQESAVISAAEKMAPAGMAQPAWKPKIFPKPEIKRVVVTGKKPSLAGNLIRPASSG